MEREHSIHPEREHSIQELIDRHLCEAIYSPDCCLEFDGGNTDVKYANGIE